jgi:hypothetical protein
MRALVLSPSRLPSTALPIGDFGEIREWTVVWVG